MAVIVKYKDQYFLWYGNTSNNQCRLLKADGTKYSGTPSQAKVTVVGKQLPHITFNKLSYVKTKQGVFSCTTGHPVTNPAILCKFK